jgi:hypothetical protein
MDLPEIPEETIDPESLIEELARYRALIPDYTQLPAEEKLLLLKAASLDPEWVNEALRAIDVSSTVQMALGISYEQSRRQVEANARWDVAERHLVALLKGVSTANLIRRHRIGLKALQVYGLLRHLIRQPEHSDLIPRYETLKEMNRLGKRKKKDQ